MLMKIVLLVAVLLPMLLTLQWLNDKTGKDNETFRKIVHIFHGVTLAALAFIVPMELIIGIEAFILISMVIARYLSENFKRVPWIRYLSRLYKVGRTSYGDFFFPISAIALVFLADSKWEFAAAVLILGLADAAAALIGKQYGKGSSYKILGQRKSALGSLAFFTVTLAVVAAFVLVAEPAITVGVSTLLLVTLIVTASENLGVYGTDNLLIPLTAVYLLNAF